MIDQLIIGDKASYDDFEASVKERTIKDGKKKEIKDTVPFSNLTYDFSAINGEVFWEEKELEYVFEIEANTPEELEEKKIAFKSWVMNVTESELHDPFIRDYHFIATFDSIDVDDSEVEKATIEVAFMAYPYMIANYKKEYEVLLTANKETTARIVNDSSHRITPTFSANVAVTITKNGTSFAIPVGETTDDTFKFEAGETELRLKSTATGSVRIFFYEEVF